jgi:hypothetical protein
MQISVTLLRRKEEAQQKQGRRGVHSHPMKMLRIIFSIYKVIELGSKNM